MVWLLRVWLQHPKLSAQSYDVSLVVARRARAHQFVLLCACATRAVCSKHPVEFARLFASNGDASQTVNRENKMDGNDESAGRYRRDLCENPLRTGVIKMLPRSQQIAA